MRIELQPLCRTPQALGALFAIDPTRIGAPSYEIRAITTDSREVQAGDLFVTCAGERTDGHRFVSDALQAGACAVLCERSETLLPKGDFWLFRCENVQKALLRAAHAWRERCGAKVIAVTGSAGKTTTKEAIAAVLGGVPHNVGNYNSTIGMPLSVLSFPRADFWVCELGINHVGEMEEMSRALAPDLCVITNVGSAHIGNFGDAFTLLREKWNVACGLSAQGFVVAPFSLKEMAADLLPCRALGVGEEPSADFVVENIVSDENGVRCDLRGQNRRIPDLAWPIPGRIGCSVIALAGACGILCGKEAEEIRAGLIGAGANMPRLRRHILQDRLLIEDCYNASPEACVAALEAVRALGGERPLVAILGDMMELGEYAACLHRALGAAVQASGCEMLVTYGTLAEEIARGAMAAGMDERRIISFAGGEEEALSACVHRRAPQNAIILCKGSHAMHMERLVVRMRRFS